MLPAFIFGANISILVNQPFPTWQISIKEKWISQKLWEFVIWTCPRIFSEGAAMKTCKAFFSISFIQIVCMFHSFVLSEPYNAIYTHWFNIWLCVRNIYIYLNTYTYTFRHIVSYIHHRQYILVFYCMCDIFIYNGTIMIQSLLDLGLHHFHVTQGNHRKEGSLQQSRGPSDQVDGWFVGMMWHPSRKNVHS